MSFSWLRRLPTSAWWFCFLFMATLVFWKLRILDSWTSRSVGLGNLDLYTEHYPMTKFGFERVFSGELPLWNPFQLCGQPFFAIPHVGLLYPGSRLKSLLPGVGICGPPSRIRWDH